MDKLQLMLDAQEMAGWDESCPVVFQDMETGKNYSVDEVKFQGDPNSTRNILFLRGRLVQ